jgi:hypothetical protein
MPSSQSNLSASFPYCVWFGMKCQHDCMTITDAHTHMKMIPPTPLTMSNLEQDILCSKVMNAPARKDETMDSGRTLSTTPVKIHPQEFPHLNSTVSLSASLIGGNQAQERQKSCDMCMIDDSMKETTRQGKWRPGPNGKGSLCDA